MSLQVNLFSAVFISDYFFLSLHFFIITHHHYISNKNSSLSFNATPVLILTSDRLWPTNELKLKPKISPTFPFSHNSDCQQRKCILLASRVVPTTMPTCKALLDHFTIMADRISIRTDFRGRAARRFVRFGTKVTQLCPSTLSDHSPSHSLENLSLSTSHSQSKRESGRGGLESFSSHFNSPQFNQCKQSEAAQNPTLCQLPFRLNTSSWHPFSLSSQLPSQLDFDWNHRKLQSHCCGKGTPRTKNGE